jgi:hypothetical protein
MAPKPYEFIGFGAVDGPQTYEFILFGAVPEAKDEAQCFVGLCVASPSGARSAPWGSLHRP